MGDGRGHVWNGGGGLGRREVGERGGRRENSYFCMVFLEDNDFEEIMKKVRVILLPLHGNPRCPS
jgi:hypothetical protein